MRKALVMQKSYTDKLESIFVISWEETCFVFVSWCRKNRGETYWNPSLKKATIRNYIFVTPANAVKKVTFIADSQQLIQSNRVVLLETE